MTDPLAAVVDRVAGQNGDRLEAVVAVEQARAVAQVAAAVQVAQQFPRDMVRVRRELADACKQYDLAAVAFYAVKNRGQDLSVHAARELAVIWGNVDAGVHELRRDDRAGVSEVQAFCWDMERNSRQTRTFQVPHAISVKDPRTGKLTREPIDDLTDVYRNNQNVGARAFRECVFATLPRAVVDYARRELRKTKNAGPPDTTLPKRIGEALGWAERMRLTRDQLERRVGKPVDAWTAEDVADLEVVAASIGRGDTTAAEQFDDAVARVDPGELTVPAQDGPGGDPAVDPPTTGGGRQATQAQLGRLIGKLRDLDVEDDDAQRAWFSTQLHRDVDTRKRITRAEFDELDRVLDALLAERGRVDGGGGS